MSGSFQAGALKDDEKIKTVEGDDTTAHFMPGKATTDGGSVVNAADYIKANVEASNGAVHS